MTLPAIWGAVALLVAQSTAPFPYPADSTTPPPAPAFANPSNCITTFIKNAHAEPWLLYVRGQYTSAYKDAMRMGAVETACAQVLNKPRESDRYRPAFISAYQSYALAMFAATFNHAGDFNDALKASENVGALYARYFATPGSGDSAGYSDLVTRASCFGGGRALWIKAYDEGTYQGAFLTVTKLLGRAAQHDSSCAKQFEKLSRDEDTLHHWHSFDEFAGVAFMAIADIASFAGNGKIDQAMIAKAKSGLQATIAHQKLVGLPSGLYYVVP